MQRVLQRTARARRVAAKKGEARKKLMEKDEEWDLRKRMEMANIFLRKSVRDSRVARREDWELGPLAPRRDIGENPHHYGTLSVYQQKLPDRPKRLRPAYIDAYSTGDRVVILRGPQRGRIDTITTVNAEGCAVMLKNTGVVDMGVSDWMAESMLENAESTVVDAKLEYPIEDIALVYPLKDEKTGVPRDVIIRKLDIVTQDWYIDEDGVKRRNHDNETRTYRKISGTDTIIPWPEKGELVQEEEYPLDTIAVDVDEITFDVPPLLHAPMPISVVDELRSKYSKFRTRHDYEFIEKKKAQDEKMVARSNLIDKMKTPLQELNELRARQRAAQQKELSTEQLARIGEVMAQEKAKAKTVGRVRALS